MRKRAPAPVTLDVDVAAALVDDAVHRREAKAGAFALPLRREEGSNRCDLVASSPDAGVRDREAERGIPAAVPARTLGDFLRRQLGRLDRERAAWASRRARSARRLINTWSICAGSAFTHRASSAIRVSILIR